jgi:uncharacterized membrane protein YoaK (UPF0700 family)
MFRQEGEVRTERHNRMLAGYLAAVAGLVNSAGFVMIGTFTSHVTGNVGRLANDIALTEGGAAALALAMIGAFFAGAFLASMALESNALARRPTVYAVLLLSEAGLLGLFWGLSSLIGPAHPRIADAQGLILCAAMGLQNSLVTRMSGAVVRTTHLTGVVTDLGIEGARWFRRWRASLAARTKVRLTVGTSPTDNFRPAKTILLLTIFIAFAVGSLLGAFLAVNMREIALIVPLVLLIGGGLLALATGLDPVPARERSGSRE